MAEFLIAHAQNKGLESARGLDEEDPDGEAAVKDSKKRRWQRLVNPMEAQGAAGPSKGGAGEKKKRGRPAKGSFTVTEDSDLLDQVAKRPVQVQLHSIRYLYWILCAVSRPFHTPVCVSILHAKPCFCFMSSHAAALASSYI